jgi:hypothetical protein
MITRIKNIALTAALILTCRAHAEAIEDGRYWFTFNAAGKLPIENWRWSLDVRPRFRDEGRHFDQLLIVPVFSYQMSPKLSLGVGFDHVRNHPAGSETLTENRIAPQIVYQFDAIGKLKLQSRTILEARWREDGDDTAYRIRERLHASYPLNDKLSVIIFDELLVHLNDADWNVHRGIDQNRLFLGMGWKVNSHAAFEMGYLNQSINTRAIDRENHVLSTTLKYNF